MNTKKYTVVTGASSGIRYGTPKAFAARGKNLFDKARRREHLETLKKEIAALHPAVDVVIREANSSSNAEAINFYESLKITTLKHGSTTPVAAIMGILQSLSCPT